MKAIAALAAPDVAQKPPGGQRLQALEPVPVEYVPAGHAVQLAAPASGLNAPGEHGKHMRLPLKLEYMPASQMAQEVATPEV